jgi:hypothetical protein
MQPANLLLLLFFLSFPLGNLLLPFFPPAPAGWPIQARCWLEWERTIAMETRRLLHAFKGPVEKPDRKGIGKIWQSLPTVVWQVFALLAGKLKFVN